MKKNKSNPLKQSHGDIEDGGELDDINQLDANEMLFLNLKKMFDTNVITSEDFKNIVEKYKENLDVIKWNREHEEILREVCEKCNVYAWFHRMTADMLRRRDNIYIYSIILLNTVTSMFSLIGSSYDEEIDVKLIAVISGGVNLSTSLVTAIYKKINMGGTVDSHLFAVNMYTKLSHNISSQLAISAKEREHMPKYLKDRLLEYENLILESPTIPGHIRNMGYKLINEECWEISIPNEISGGINRVNVYTEPEEPNKNYEYLQELKTTPSVVNKVVPKTTIKNVGDILMKCQDSDDASTISAIIIQKHIRGYLARKYCRKLRKSIIIQKHFRGYLARRYYRVLREIQTQTQTQTQQS
tara:strand:+ start:2786 stop:3856 length:1071 start_codon:yes stop_codon:yes gene_type:complete